jgi:hypothetical protein
LESDAAGLKHRFDLAAMNVGPLPGSTPDSFAAYVKTKVDRWGRHCQEFGATLQ